MFEMVDSKAVRKGFEMTVQLQLAHQARAPRNKILDDTLVQLVKHIHCNTCMDTAEQEANPEWHHDIARHEATLAFESKFPV